MHRTPDKGTQSPETGPAGPRAEQNCQRLTVLYNPACLLHETVELLGSSLVPAYESPERIRVIRDALISCPTDFDVMERQTLPEAQLLKHLLSCHDEAYIHHLQSIHKRWVADGLIAHDGHVLPECFRTPSRHLELHRRTAVEPVDPFAQSGFYAFDMSTGISKGTWASVAASATLAIEAAEMLAAGARDVLALCRPPGHHCTGRMAGGYCYVNNVVVAVTALRERLRAEAGAGGEAVGQAPKIAILDLDFHHGNGTQDFFYDDPTLYVSIHGENEYPYYTGGRDETGFGAGQGLNLNLPLKSGSSLDEYLQAVDVAMERLEAFDPDFLFVSLGFDSFKGDPLGFFMIETGDYRRIARRVRQETEWLSGVPAAILLEGGYVVGSLGENMVSFLKGWKD